MHKLFECIRRMQLGFAAAPAMGTDGSDHDLTIAFSPTCSISGHWWTELPVEWKGLMEIVRILRKGAAAAQGHSG